MEVLLCDLRHSLFHLLNSLITTASELRELPKVTRSNIWTMELSWFPSWLNSLWQEWSCGLVHYPSRNTTEPIWKMLASSDGISSWTPLKPQHSNPNPNRLENQLWSIDFLTPPTSLIIPHRLPCLPWISYDTQKLMLDSCKLLQKQSEAYHTFLWHFFQV